MLEHPNGTLAGQTLATLGGGAFPETRWTLVVAAGDTSHPDSRRALTALCEAYWYPLYAYLRRLGHPAERAQHLTQQFFLNILGRSCFDRADPDRGRFRSFLLAAIRHFLTGESNNLSAQPQTSGATAALPFAIAGGEERYLREPAHNETPERIYERRWARALLDRVIGQIRDEFVRHGRLDHFNRIKVYLLGQAEVPYAELAPKVGMSENALKVSIHRLRKRYRDLLRAEVAATVADEAEVDNELRYLVSALSAKPSPEA